jgi:anti-sigma factor RsiW
MTPDCRRVLSEISTYLDGDLDQAACDTIEQHCATCASCAAVVADLKQAAGLCRRAGAIPLPTGVLERARASVRRLLDDAANGDD